MKRMIKIFFVLLLINGPMHGAFQSCARDAEIDQEQIALFERYQQVRFEYQTTIICMLALLDSNKHLLMNILELETNLFAQEVTLQALQETEWKICALKKRLTAS